MIQLKEAKDCCGCNACVQKCPANCIVMYEGTEGFSYPKINTDLCLNCGICEQVCPVIHQGNEGKPKHVYAAKNNNETIREQSSSGGIFSLLAEKVLSQNGVVFGVRFDENWDVIHDYTETTMGLAAFRGSKYVQSNINDNFTKTEQFLQAGRKVLFSGTPCQIAGLKLFLQKEYENLLTVDFVCHGVPSPKVWRLYLEELLQSKKFRKETKIITNDFSTEQIKKITFRSKSLSWKKYHFQINIQESKEIKIFSELSGNNIFMRGFLKDLYLRPSCYDCPSKCFKSGSDITIGDYWGVENILPEYDDDKGISLVMINTDKANEIYQKLDINFVETSYNDALRNNPAIEKSVKIPKERLLFFRNLNSGNILELIASLTKESMNIRIRRSRLFLFIHKLIKQ